MSKLEETASPPRVVQVVSQQSYEEACPERGICVLAFLPHILDRYGQQRVPPAR